MTTLSTGGRYCFCRMISLPVGLSRMATMPTPSMSAPAGRVRRSAVSQTRSVPLGSRYVILCAMCQADERGEERRIAVVGVAILHRTYSGRSIATRRWTRQTAHRGQQDSSLKRETRQLGHPKVWPATYQWRCGKHFCTGKGHGDATCGGNGRNNEGAETMTMATCNVASNLSKIAARVRWRGWPL